MRTFSLMTFLSLLTLLVCSQATFEKTFGSYDNDEGAAIAVCSDGTYILAGSVENIYTGDADVFLARINPDGDTLWTREFYNEYKDDYATDVIQSADQGFIITGYTTSDNISTPFLLKYDESGHFVWLKKYGTEIPDGYAIAMVEKPDSGYMISGRRDYYNADWYHRPFMLETNQEGDCIWYDIYTFGDYAKYQVNHMFLTDENEYVLCGYYEQSDISLIGHAWLFKVDSGMNVVWTKTYGPSDSTASSYYVEPAGDGGYIICGTIYPGSIPWPGGDYDIFLVKTDSSGTAVWTRSIGNSDDSEYGRCIKKTEDGGYIIGGQSNFGTGNLDIWMLKTDEMADTLWTRRYGGSNSEGIREICLTPDGGYLLCGTTDSYGMGGTDIYLVKTDENGLMTRIKENEDVLSAVKVFPNPGNGLFLIRNCPENMNYKIFDFCGRLVVSKEQATGPVEKVDISNQSPGIYFLRVTSSLSSRSFEIIRNR